MNKTSQHGGDGKDSGDGVFQKAHDDAVTDTIVEKMVSRPTDVPENAPGKTCC